VCQADPSWVDLVLLGGDVTYGRADWFATLTDSATSGTIEQLTAWGKPMTLDNGYHSGPVGSGGPQPSLEAIRALLTANSPSAGPIFAQARLMRSRLDRSEQDGYLERCAERSA
jgi:5-methylthioadenosine/S-adenosylhomocysteine deaminase